MTTSTRKSLIVFYSVIAAAGILIGSLLLLFAAFLSPETVSDIVRGVLIVCGIITIISNIPGLVSGIGHMRTTVGAVELVLAALGILFGILLIAYQGQVVVAIVGAYLIVFPLLIVLFSDDRKAALRAGWPRMAIGVLLLVALPMLVWSVFEIVHLLLLVSGWAVIGVSVLVGIVGIIRAFLVSSGRHTPIDRSQGSGKRLYVDETGDGVVDVIYEDNERK